MDLGLKGKKVIMNGGSHGLGLASLKTYAAEGCDVAFFSSNAERVAAAEKQIDAAGSGKVFGAELDMTGNPEGYASWLEKAVKDLGGCDIFIHTASASGQGATGDWDRCLDLDIKGATIAIEVLTPALAASDCGSVIFMSSTAALEKFVAPQAFNAIKAAMITYGSQLSQALAPQGIRVNCVSPGPIEYPSGNWETIKANMEDFYDGVVAQMPMGRLGEPQEVANSVVFLSSPASPYTTGANLVIDGGFTKRVQF
ncbi:MAG: SDR family oxidoreductase [Porticoccaceae bacterium]|jgi:3-oxoacyl-[acyl-carrier protein] reductase|nr:SDR family oxidoreductase [Porticoccaceae bacterium]MDE0875176.1 SDR family oxidoreductase [Porticoccaceae bacterium]|tara:strand:- start:669 stop:1433 length:765 start_codon:yes stop_codon:yes gene_type:complete